MRIWMLSGLALWLIPLMIVGGLGLGLPLGAAIPAGALVATALSTPLSALLERSVGAALLSSRALRVATLACTLAAVIQIALLSVFIADPHRPRFSTSPGDPFRREHSCMSSYAEAARFLAEGGHDIYDGTRYQPRFIGPLKVDPYHYPPPFLLIPQGIHAIAGDFFRFRALWFVLQGLVLLGTIIAVAAWVRDAGGAFALAGGALLLAAPPVLYTLQQGNFQATAAPLTGLACMLIASRRLPAGAALLAYTAAAKIFPGIILVYLAAARRWRVLAWTAALGMLLLGVTLLTQGTRPTSDFLTHALPEISSGAAFPHTERPNSAAVNGSVYGMTVRLRRLGMSMLDQPAGMQIASVYGVLVIGVAAFAGWRARERNEDGMGRLRFLQVIVGLVDLASFRSPFVGATYGVISTLWLMTLIGAAFWPSRTAWAWFAGSFGLALAVWWIPSPSYPPTPLTLVVSGLLFLVTLGVNAWAVMFGCFGGRLLSSHVPDALTHAFRPHRPEA